ncbi:hypothetical protein Trydic_g18788 [Trypoxylus dichotomus]
METDTPQPSTSATKPSYTAAVKKNAGKETKTSKESKTPSTPSGPKPSLKKPVKSQLPTKSSPAIIEEVFDYDASEATSRPKSDVINTLSQRPSCSAFTPAIFQQPRTSTWRCKQTTFASSQDPGVVCKVENCRLSRDKHARAFLEKRFPKKKARQLNRTHPPRRHHPLAASYQILGGHIVFPSELGSAHISRPRSRTAAITHMSKLQALQNRMLRMVLNAPWFVKNTTLHEDAAVEPRIDSIRRIATRFFDKAVDHWKPSCLRLRITTPGSSGGTFDHGHSLWATRTDSTAPSLLIATQK